MKETEVDFSAREMTEDITYSDLDEGATIGNVRSQFSRANRRRRSSYTAGEHGVGILDPNEDSIACQGLASTARLSSSLPEVPVSTDALTCPTATSFHQTCTNDRTGPPTATSGCNFSVSSLASSDVGGSSVYGTARKKPTAVGLQTFFPTTSVDALYPDETIHQLNFKERLASEVAHFQLCEHVIGELEAVHFSCLLPESWRRVEKILVDAEDFQPFESPPLHRQARRNRPRLSSLRSRSLSGEPGVSDREPGSSLSPPCQRSRRLSLDAHIPQFAAATVEDLSSSPSVGTLLPHSLTGLVPSQAAQAATGLLRCCLDRQQRQQSTPSRPGLADTLRFRRLQEICASLSDLDWVDAQAAATLRLLAFTGQVGPALISNSRGEEEEEVPSSGSGEGELLDFDDRLTDSYYTCVSGATGRACGSHYPASLHSRKPSLSTAFWSLSDYQSIYSPASPSEGRSLSRPTSHPRQLQTPMPSVTPDLTLSSEPLRYPPSLQSEVGASWSIGVENYFRNVSTSVTAAHHRPSFSRFASSLVSSGHQLITSAPVPKSKRQSILAGQRNHCAGCGVHVETKYLRSMRFCEYFGRFFCCTCHTNTLMVVPSAVLFHWSFLMLPVSNFARDILCRLHSRPVIHLADFQPSILKREHVLRDAIELRRQASRMVPFLRLCREGSSSVSAVEHLPPHWYASADNWSLADLCAVAQGSLSSRLRRALEPCVEHLSTCLRCKARGFLCEVCHTGRVLFPFGQVNTVVCVDCGACFHRTCLSRPPSADSCPRCLRRRERAAAASLQRRSGGGEEEEEVVEGVLRKSPTATDAKLAVSRTADGQLPILLNTLSSSATSAVSATPAGKELTAA
ncbi:hypothetical protein AAHC03_026131 [Spirometra sp. Aus1]